MYLPIGTSISCSMNSELKACDKNQSLALSLHHHSHVVFNNCKMTVGIGIYFKMSTYLVTGFSLNIILSTYFVKDFQQCPTEPFSIQNLYLVSSICELISTTLRLLCSHSFFSQSSHPALFISPTISMNPSLPPPCILLVISYILTSLPFYVESPCMQVFLCSLFFSLHEQNEITKFKSRKKW